MNKPVQLLLIRHAETDLAGTFCGQANPSVNEAGQLQIAELVSRLQPHRLEAVYSSDLARALTTAEAIATAFSVPMHINTELREISFGDWEGLTWQECEQQDAAYAKRWADEFPKLPAKNGEKFVDFERRVLMAFDRIVASEQWVAVVTHAGVLRSILTARCGWSDAAAWAGTKEYCSVLRYESGEARPYVG